MKLLVALGLLDTVGSGLFIWAFIDSSEDRLMLINDILAIFIWFIAALATIDHHGIRIRRMLQGEALMSRQVAPQVDRDIETQARFATQDLQQSLSVEGPRRRSAEGTQYTEDERSIEDLRFVCWQIETCSCVVFAGAAVVRLLALYEFDRIGCQASEPQGEMFERKRLPCTMLLTAANPVMISTIILVVTLSVLATCGMAFYTVCCVLNCVWQGVRLMAARVTSGAMSCFVRDVSPAELPPPSPNETPLRDTTRHLTQQLDL